MIKKSYFTRSISRTPANNKEKAICNNCLQLKAVHYSIATRSSILNVSSGCFWLQLYFVKYSNGKYKSWDNLVTKIIRNHVKQCSYHEGYWSFNLKASNAIYSLILFYMFFVCHSYVICMYSYVTRMPSACHSYVLVYHPYVTRMYSHGIRRHSYVLVCRPYASRMYSYATCVSLVCCFTMNHICVKFMPILKRRGLLNFD